MAAKYVGTALEEHVLFLFKQPERKADAIIRGKFLHGELPCSTSRGLNEACYQTLFCFGINAKITSYSSTAPHRLDLQSAVFALITKQSLVTGLVHRPRL